MRKTVQNNYQISAFTIPSLQGTLAKPTKHTLQSNFAKEPFRPSRSNAGLKDSANLIDKMIENDIKNDKMKIKVQSVIDRIKSGERDIFL